MRKGNGKFDVVNVTLAVSYKKDYGCGKKSTVCDKDSCPRHGCKEGTMRDNLLNCTSPPVGECANLH